MKIDWKNMLVKAGICLLAASIPALLIAYGFQTKKYADLVSEVNKLEKKQEQLIEQNKKLVGEISVLSSTDRIEKAAVEELGMHKAETTDIVRVEMNGGENK